MALSTRHGFTFHLYFDPEGLLWFEVHRNRDGAVLQFTSEVDTGISLDEAADRWIAEQLEDQFSHLSVVQCRSCRQPCQQLRYTENCLDPSARIAWRFDLCHGCADRFRAQNPWILDDEDDDADDCDSEDW